MAATPSAAAPKDTQPTVTVHIDRDLAEKLIALAGFTIGGGGRDALTYTLPGGTSRTRGGTFGTDYLWARDEALYVALSVLGDAEAVS